MSWQQSDMGGDMQERFIRRAWEDAQFAEKLRANPRAAIAEETGLELPQGLEVRVHEESDNTLHLVIPKKPAGMEQEPVEPYPLGTITTPGGSQCVTLGCACTRR